VVGEGALWLAVRTGVRELPIHRGLPNKSRLKKENNICLFCKKHFSIKLGTIMEDSPMGLNKC
jgi:hypothetical protein